MPSGGFIAIHVVVYVFLYLIPRAVHHLLVRWPITCGQWLLGLPRTYCSRREREVRVIAHPRRTEARDAFGLTPGEVGSDVVWQYDGPLYSGHIHTILGGCRPPPHAVPYVTELITAPDGTVIPFDIVSPRMLANRFSGCSAPAPSPDAAPREASSTEGDVKGMILVIPGLMNSSKTPYVQQFVMEAVRDNYYVGVLNYRGFGSYKLMSPQLFGATYTEDLRFVVGRYLAPAQLQSRLGCRDPVPLIAVGFSLGGTLLCKYLGEEGQRRRDQPCPITAAICVTTPYDLNESDRQSRSWIFQRVYMPPFTNGLRRYARHNEAVFRQLANVPQRDELFDAKPVPLLSRMRTIREFDAAVMAPSFGFASPEAYYTAGSSFPFLAHATVPVLAIMALDDPVAGNPPSIESWRALTALNSNVVALRLPSGGHLGFLGTPLEEASSKRNLADRVVLAAAASFTRHYASPPPLCRV